MIETNKLYLGDCIDVMATFPNECIDLTVTSPPYDKKGENKKNRKGKRED